MTTGMQIFLIIGSVLTCAYMLNRIRKSQMRTENALFWFFFSFVLVLLGVFPGIADWFASLLGFQSTVNMVFLVIIFLLVIRVFLQDQKAAKMESKMSALMQTYAIDRKEDKDREGGSAPAPEKEQEAGK